MVPQPILSCCIVNVDVDGFTLGGISFCKPVGPTRDRSREQRFSHRRPASEEVPRLCPSPGLRLLRITAFAALQPPHGSTGSRDASREALLGAPCQPGS